ncbi:hypothetical protein PR048_020620 [Dryococelus australis]|uniref:Uncharacterized protein n=1 Tax=Dryococelus australis TaxID=614101 RepID=A0ABQ9H781_9NEOP|nr:hypothetical protein PR048_020620 [Dryococelus australis]
MGAAGPLPPMKYTTAFPSLVHDLDHVTPACQSRTTRAPLPGLQISTKCLAQIRGDSTGFSLGLELLFRMGKFREFNDLQTRLHSPVYTRASDVCSLAAAAESSQCYTTPGSMTLVTCYLASLPLAQSSEGNFLSLIWTDLPKLRLRDGEFLTGLPTKPAVANLKWGFKLAVGHRKPRRLARCRDTGGESHRIKEPESWSFKCQQVLRVFLHRATALRKVAAFRVMGRAASISRVPVSVGYASQSCLYKLATLSLKAVHDKSVLRARSASSLAALFARSRQLVSLSHGGTRPLVPHCQVLTVRSLHKTPRKQIRIVGNRTYSQTSLPLVRWFSRCSSSIARNSATQSLINSNSTAGLEACRNIYSVGRYHFEGLKHPELRSENEIGHVHRQYSKCPPLVAMRVRQRLCCSAHCHVHSRKCVFIPLLYTHTGVAMAERLARSPPTKANRVQTPAGSPHFRKWESCWTMLLVGGFSRGSPASRCSAFTSVILIGS